MLGYVIPDKGELKVREYEIYTGYYCGVCKYIGRTYGQLPRMVLSYDATFIALLLACVDPEPDQPTQEHCVVHHIKRKTVIRNRAIEYAGDLMLILAWYKLLDDAQDEGKVSAKAGLAAFRPIWRKLEAKHPSLCAMIGERLTALTELEKAHCDSIDRVAEDFAQVMDGIFRDGITWLYGEAAEDGDATGNGAGNEEPKDLQNGTEPDVESNGATGSTESSEKKQNLHETFANIGYHLGKWIYLIDAVDDIEENLESGCYNPLLYRFRFQDGSGQFGAPEQHRQQQHTEAENITANQAEGSDASPDSISNCIGDNIGPETPEAFRARIDDMLRFNLYQYLAVISESMEALDIQKNSGIIENVIYFGLNRKTEEVLKRIQPEKRGHGLL